MNNEAIKSALSAAGIKFDRIRKHGDTGFRINKVDDVEKASAVLKLIEGASVETGDGIVTVDFKPGTPEEKQTEEVQAAAERTKNPEYDVVFDQALKALESGDTLATWKAGRKVRMMQTIRNLYPKAFEKKGRNVVFVGKIEEIDKAHVLSNLGLKTERSIPEAFRTQKEGEQAAA